LSALIFGQLNSGGMWNVCGRVEGGMDFPSPSLSLFMDPKLGEYGL